MGNKGKVGFVEEPSQVQGVNEEHVVDRGLDVVDRGLEAFDGGF